ncbi:hypothetical protein VNO77_33494 [Canavalia gladiata]|uniref:Uncharacterized protein n=1 Tax=Canavalia gladiata TaxID=3824 RepID=A0AAN9KEZ9_CANGL
MSGGEIKVLLQMLAAPNNLLLLECMDTMLCGWVPELDYAELHSPIKEEFIESKKNAKQEDNESSGGYKETKKGEKKIHQLKREFNSFACAARNTLINSTSRYSFTRKLRKQAYPIRVALSNVVHYQNGRMSLSAVYNSPYIYKLASSQKFRTSVKTCNLVLAPFKREGVIKALFNSDQVDHLAPYCEEEERDFGF